jgi:hypothetical protein
LAVAAPQRHHYNDWWQGNRVKIRAENKKTALKAFRDLWIAGTAGGFLAALMRSVPHHFVELTWPLQWPHATDLLIRYLYMLWLVGYIFINGMLLKYDQPAPSLKNVVHETGQSIASFIALYALGFANPSEGFHGDRSRFAFIVANMVILGMCGSPLLILPQKTVAPLRLGGAILAALSIVMLGLTRGPMEAWQISVLLVIEILLWILLLAYGRLRVMSLANPERQ